MTSPINGDIAFLSLVWEHRIVQRVETINRYLFEVAQQEVPFLLYSDAVPPFSVALPGEQKP
jgi:hypothetical protein